MGPPGDRWLYYLGDVTHHRETAATRLGRLKIEPDQKGSKKPPERVLRCARLPREKHDNIHRSICDVKRLRFIAQTAGGVLASSLPYGIPLFSPQDEVIFADAELQFDSLVEGFSGLVRTPLTAQIIRAAYQNPEIRTLAVAAKPGCVGIGWRYARELERNVVHIDVTPAAWRSEEHVVEFVRKFFTKGSVTALNWARRRAKLCAEG